MEICFATNNKNKIKEVWQVLPPDFSLLSLEDIGCLEDLAETQDTIEGNALQKAQYVFNKYKVPCFADDSGLEVDELGGAPGVYSARYAGLHRDDDDNIKLLLSKLNPGHDRRAQFRTVIALTGFGAKAELFQGIVRGHITEAKRGTGGFGYDPVFVPVNETRTFGEMSLSEKNRISHRAKAVEQLISFLRGYHKTA